MKKRAKPQLRRQVESAPEWLSGRPELADSNSSVPLDALEQFGRPGLADSTNSSVPLDALGQGGTIILYVQVAACQDISVTRDGSECLNTRGFPFGDLTYLYGGPVIFFVASSLVPLQCWTQPRRQP